jgi:hypothetical protein
MPSPTFNDIFRHTEMIHPRQQHQPRKWGERIKREVRNAVEVRRKTLAQRLLKLACIAPG